MIDLIQKTIWSDIVRRLLKVQIDEAIEADRMFTILIGDEVEQRREFIESNALRAMTIVV
jgi:DNA gyrase subunit B